MRKIDIIKKASVYDLSMGDKVNPPTNLIAYNISLQVDDNKTLPSIFYFSLKENANKVGFSDDWQTFVSYAQSLEFITLNCGRNWLFLLDHYNRYQLNNCILKIRIDDYQLIEFKASVSIKKEVVMIAVLKF